MKQIILALMTVGLFSVANAQGSEAPQQNEQTNVVRAQKHEARKAERQAAREEMKEKIKSACAEDVSKTGCTGEGRELMKCVHDYKKSNKDFKFSDSCKSAFKDAKVAKQDWKKKHKEAKSTN